MIRKKDDFMFGTKHSPMATRVRRLCSILSFHTSLRLPNLTTPKETPRPLVSCGLCQGLVVFFINLHMAEARDFHCSSHVAENLGKKIIPRDRAAVRLVIQKPAHRGHQSKRIPSWMSKHPIFGSILQQLHDDHRFSPDPCRALTEIKILLHKTKKITKRELSKQTPDCIGTKLLITSTALRAYRNRHLGTLMRCCEAWTPIDNCFDTLSFECIEFQRLYQMFARLSRENQETRETEVSTHPWTQTEKDIALARCRNGQRAWRNKKLVLTLSAVTDEEGDLLENEDESGTRLCEYWAPFAKHARKARGIINMMRFCDMFNKLMMPSIGLLIRLSLTTSSL